MMQKWLDRFMRDQTPNGSRFRAGIILILASFPVSWTSPLISSALLASSSAWLSLSAGLAVYAFSWVLFVMGIWLARKRGLVMLRKLWHGLTGRRKKRRTT
jgi:hypothetical protein